VALLILTSYPLIGQENPFEGIPNKQFDAVRSHILEELRKGEIPSVSVAVAKDGKIIWEEAFGWADKEKQIMATPHTMYSLASISKPMTATGLMVLVERGEVDLNMPVEFYLRPAKLTEYEGKSYDATVKHLLNHTAGLPMHFNYFYADEPHRPPSMLVTIKRYGILVHPPSELFQYANLGYGIIGHVISRVTKKSFADFIYDEVFTPLRMSRTTFDLKPDLVEKYAAKKYDSKGNLIPLCICDAPGAGHAYSSAHDLIRFGMFHLKDQLPGNVQLLKDKTINGMQKDRDPKAVNLYDPSAYYGLGWFFKENEHGFKAVWHEGGWAGASTMLKLIPSEDIAVVVLLNCYDNKFCSKVTNEIFSIVLPEYGEKLKAQSSDAGSTKQKPQISELIGKWTGTIKTWAGEVPISITFQENGDHVAKMQSEPGSNKETAFKIIRLDKGNLVGRFEGTIPTEDAKRNPHIIFLDMTKKENSLTGFASALTEGDRMNCVSSYIKLTKE